MAPRRSLRNILAALVDAQVDVSGKGATVSDGIQLTYLLDDLRASFWVSAGTGSFLADGGGTTHGALQIQCRNRRGLVIDELILVMASGSDNCIFGVRTDPDVVTFTTETILPPSMVGPKPPLAIVRLGHITNAQYIAQQGVIMGSNDTTSTGGWGAGFQLGVGQTLLMAQDRTGRNALIGMRWHELDSELVE